MFLFANPHRDSNIPIRTIRYCCLRWYFHERFFLRHVALLINSLQQDTIAVGRFGTQQKSLREPEAFCD